MEQRYELMAQLGVRSIFDYKKMCKEKNQTDELPFIVVIIDELADLMMVARKEVEDAITRLAQMARAAGIHLIVATQRPSVDVITGIIKVNFPSRISFRVTSKVDSRTVLDALGAETLLGKGDMLFMDSKSARMRRVHGAYVTDEEIERVVNHVKAQQKVEYINLEETVAAYQKAI
jgi:S-DNA-T family DNA segregation ATPase FtsK/SpoIIIE